MSSPVQSGIRYVSCLESSGYGCAGLDYVLSLYESNIPVLWRWLYWDGREYRTDESPSSAATLQRVLAENGLSRRFLNGLEQLEVSGCRARTAILHCVPELWQKFPEAGLVRVGMTVWETDRPPGRWIPLLNSVDHLIVPGEFTKRVFEAAGVETPIKVIPHIYRPTYVGTSRSGADFRRKHRIPSSHFLFYNLEDWTARKSVWQTVNAYLLAFTDRDDVTLVIKTSRQGVTSPRARQRLPVREIVAGIRSNYMRPAAVVVIDGKVPDEQIGAMHAAGDAYVSLTHGEGWGLSVFHAAAAGNPVVITGWGGQLDYLGEQYPFLIEYRMVPVVDTAGQCSYSPDQRWARADVDAAITMLRSVYQMRDGVRSLVSPLTRTLQRDFGPSRVVPLFRQFL